MAARPLCLALVVLLASLGCTPSEKSDAPNGKDDEKAKGDEKKEPVIETVEHVDVGTACVSGSADQPHEVKVEFNICLSSSCDELASASCTVEQSGTELKVSGKATVRSDRGPDGICSTDCIRPGAVCKTPALAAGTYTLSYAGKQTEVTVPVADSVCTPAQ
jgi:hypothetical protein